MQLRTGKYNRHHQPEGPDTDLESDRDRMSITRFLENLFLYLAITHTSRSATPVVLLRTRTGNRDLKVEGSSRGKISKFD